MAPNRGIYIAPWIALSGNAAPSPAANGCTSTLRNARCEFPQNFSAVARPLSSAETPPMFTPSKVQTLPIAELKPRPGNARTHSQKQIRKIAQSIRQFGFVNPIIVDDASCIIAGHGRLEAARLLGMGSVPTIRLTHLSRAEVRALVIADNKLATLAGWDRELLSIEIAELSQARPSWISPSPVSMLKSLRSCRTSRPVQPRMMKANPPALHPKGPRSPGSGTCG